MPVLRRARNPRLPNTELQRNQLPRTRELPIRILQIRHNRERKRSVERPRGNALRKLALRSDTARRGTSRNAARSARLGPTVASVLILRPDTTAGRARSSRGLPNGTAGRRGVAETATSLLSDGLRSAPAVKTASATLRPQNFTELCLVCYAEKEGDDVGDRALSASTEPRRKMPCLSARRQVRSVLCLSATLANGSFLAGQLCGPRQSARPHLPTQPKLGFSFKENACASG